MLSGAGGAPNANQQAHGQLVRGAKLNGQRAGGAADESALGDGNKQARSRVNFGSTHTRFEPDYVQDDEQRNKFLESNEQDRKRNKCQQQTKATLAKQESLLVNEDQDVEDRRLLATDQAEAHKTCAWLSALYCCCCRCACFAPDNQASEGRKHDEAATKRTMLHKVLCWCPLLLVLIYSVAIYCVPFVDIVARVPEALPSIPFDFNEGPLRPSTASQFKVEHLFRGQIRAPESIALDSLGNAYMAIEGGFVLYAHLNKSSPFNANYLGAAGGRAEQQLVKIAELNGVRQVSTARVTRSRRAGSEQRATSEQQVHYQQVGAMWRRECQLDEQLYGPHLHEGGHEAGAQTGPQKFETRVRVSRCSKPLGLRLSADSSALYVIDTLTGLYKVHLGVAERANSNQRLVTRLVDFRANNWQHTLAVVPPDSPGEPLGSINVSLRAVDDLAIDSGAGTNSADLIYMTVASQQWPAVSFVYDLLEGRPSGLLVRFDTGLNQLVVLEPKQVAHVRTAAGGAPLPNDSSSLAGLGPALAYGAPHLDENDVFDDRPLFFPNGLELTDDKQALLIVDTANKRIVKHYIRGPRHGSSDLWAHVPNYADNIRRGYDRGYETYWVVGCGRTQRTSSQSSSPPNTMDLDPFSMLRSWPVVKKFALKNIYFVGWFIEQLGQHLLRSDTVRDYGYELRMGSSLCQQGCSGMMILQFNQNGDLIRSIHSREFPNDLKYYSQVNELIDAQTQEHLLYLSSPAYNYITKLSLPTESYPPSPYPVI